MKKFILFSACLFLLSACNNDKPDAPEIQANPILKVSMQDIQKAVRDALDNPINGMPNFDVPVIDAIDSIQADYRPAQSTEKTHYRKTLLYFVKLIKGPTVMVGADKRAEPIYGILPNADLKFGKGKLLAQDQLQAPCRLMIGAAAASALCAVETTTTPNPRWALLQTEKGRNMAGWRRTKCPVVWGQGYPLNLLSPSSEGPYADRGKAAAGSVPVALAQTLPVFKKDFSVFYGYNLKTSWAKLRNRTSNTSFTAGDEQNDIAVIVNYIGISIGQVYNKDGSATATLRRGLDFLSDYLGRSLGYDQNWNNVSRNMKANSHGITLLSVGEQNNDALWKRLGIERPKSSEICLLLDGFEQKNGATLFYVNSGCGEKANGYYLYDDKIWQEVATCTRLQTTMNFDVCAAACIAEIKPEVPPNTCLAGLSACWGARRYILFPFFSFTEKNTPLMRRPASPSAVLLSLMKKHTQKKQDSIWYHSAYILIFNNLRQRPSS